MRNLLFAASAAPFLFAALLHAQPAKRTAVFHARAPRILAPQIGSAAQECVIAEIVVPVLRAQTSVAQTTNRAVRDWSQQHLTRFVRDATQYAKEKQAGAPEAYFYAAPTNVFVTPRLVSLSMAHSDSMGIGFYSVESTGFSSCLMQS